MTQIDEIDGKILRALLKDGRTRLKDMAKETGLSSGAIKKRIENLHRGGIIFKPILISNMNYFGYGIMALIGISLESSTEDEIIEIITDQITVAGIDKTIGEYDMTVFVFAKTVNELDELKNILVKQKSVQGVEINIWNKMLLNYGNIQFL